MDVDIWAWVADTQRRLHEGGNTGLAIALGDLPAQAFEGRYAQLDVMAPAVAQQAESQELPWLEFFARHWHLAGRIGDRAQGRVALGDAEALLAFSRREDTKDCPSAPAAVEALAVTQANTDGPGYAAERLAALGAAMADVPHASPAFNGLATQYVSALSDAGEVEQAVTYYQSAVAGRRSADGQVSWELAAMGVRALLAAGRTEEALSELDAAKDFPADDPAAKEHREGVLRALVLATTGRSAEALAALPDLDVVGEHPRDWVEWARAVRLLTSVISNTWQLGRVMRQWVTYFETMGVEHGRVELALIAGELAVARQGIWQARALADLAESGLGALRRPGDLPERVAALRASAEAARPLAAPGPQDELVAYFDAADGHNADPERWVGWLWPLSGTDLEATRRHATTLAFLGYADLGADFLWKQVVDDGDPASAEEEDIAYLTGVLVEAGQDERVESFAAMLSAPSAHLVLGRLHRARERWAETQAEAEKSLAAGAEGVTALEARRLLAGAAQQTGDNAKGAAILRDLVASGVAEEEDVWRMIVMATASEDWPLVRKGAEALGMPVATTEGPIEEEWHLVRVVLPASDGSRREVLAVRTGPATARLLIPQPRGMDYNAGDIVVIDPRPLEPVPESAEEQENFVIPFGAVSMLRPGGYTSWFFDGVAPSEDDWTEFNEVMAERGWPMWVYSDENYTVTHPGTGERLQGVYGWIAVPPDVEDVEVDALLDDATERWVHPLAWLDLARSAGIEVERHERITKEYGL
ncbi:tetratricopeptide repeat protein [Sphaerisporangium sp. TRM90804]|uniref:tetratricopeptide repeat protein n=1 Tax=Sphaerisporangium sp. TRM90804 TaxID=3031113 RepID=UPI00244AA781|nr:tetratricopeptide repeat protein [Sphaerisporangium sp. TRM90804]MDH2425136.1 tetratricopeptide repeat protein [Sphaerisporangium sp. TRM90804]